MATFAMSIGAMFGSAAVSELVTRLTYFLHGRYELHSGIKGKLQKLKELLLEVASIVEAAAEKEIKNKKLVEWFMELKDVAYEADDVLDTFEYRLLDKKANDDEEVSSFASSSSNIFKRIRVAPTYYTLLLPDDDVNELDHLLERLERMASKLRNFLTLLCLDGQSMKSTCITRQRLTSSLPMFRHTFVGRVKEKEQIVSFLLSEELHGAGNVPILPIVGIGGVGKTTLAQVVYNDERVKTHFSLQMWVCVAESFDEDRLTREILDQADSQANHAGVTNFNALHENLKKKLSSEKFMLVLDDVWNDTQRQAWDILKAPLCHGKEGSKILVTSRLLEVARLMGTVDPITLEGLPEDEYWSFFKEYTFGGDNPEKYPRLITIGRKIASKLNGSPLAAKTVGALLKNNLDADHWESISKSEIWELDKNQDGIMTALKLSYLHLPTHLQQCFAYLSIYPKGWRFGREEVIRMWMAQGMIHHDSRMKRIEDVGEDYFNELISKSFFQSTIEEDHYTIHDLLHDLAESVSKDDCFRIEGDEFKIVPTTIRHLSSSPKHLDRLKENTFVLNNLRTFLILRHDFSEVPNDVDLQNVLIQLKKIRMLILGHCEMRNCPDNLGNLIHLRYLDFSGNFSIKELSAELTKLYHLQTLDLHGLSLNHLPRGMDKLTNLRHLICSDKTVVKVAGIGKMTCLQELSMFCVQKNPQFKIAQLKYLRELHGCLAIDNLYCVESEEEAKEAMLCNKGNLDKLQLFWKSIKGSPIVGRQINPNNVESGVLEGLRPHPNLKELEIVGYNGFLSPSWMILDHSLTNLVSLKLTNCNAWEDLPPLGQLAWLKDLELRTMDAVKTIGHWFHGEKGFPSLQRLIFSSLSKWEVWSADEEATLFPCLQYLKIKLCPRLKDIPPLPPTLLELELVDVGLTILPKFLASCLSSSSSSLETLTINECTDLELVGEWFLQEHNNLRHLVELHIDLCDEPKPLLLNGISKLVRLERLHIGCSYPFVTSDMEEDKGLLPSSLKKLKLEKCYIVDNLLSKCLQGISSLHSLVIKHLPDITTISFPQGLQQLTRLEELVITDCKELSSLVSLAYEEIPLFPCLQSLEIKACPKLEAIPPISSTLKTLHISHAGLTIFPDFLLTSSSSTFSSLQSLKLFMLPDIRTISFPQGLHQLTRMEELVIEDCKELSSLVSLEAILTLKELIVFGCPKLTPLPCSSGQDQVAGLSEEEREEMGLSSVSILSIDNTLLLKLLLSRKGLASIQDLKISDSDELGIDKEAFQHLTSLQRLEIINCKSLQALPELKNLHSLHYLHISECPKLGSLPSKEAMPPFLRTLLVYRCNPVLEEQQWKWASLAKHMTNPLS